MPQLLVLAFLFHLKRFRNYILAPQRLCADAGGDTKLPQEAEVGYSRLLNVNQSTEPRAAFYEVAPSLPL